MEAGLNVFCAQSWGPGSSRGKTDCMPGRRGLEAEDGWTNEEESRADLGLLHGCPAWRVDEEKNGRKNGRADEKRRKRKKWKWGGKMEPGKEEGDKVRGTGRRD